MASANAAIGLSHSIGGIVMALMFKARYFTPYSLLFVSIVCQSFAATRSYLQIAESDNPREVFKKTLSASQGVKSYRVRIEVPSASKVATIMEYALPDRVRISEKNEVTLWIGKNSYRKEGGSLWKKYPKEISDESLWAKNLEEESAVSVAALPAFALENLIKKLAQTEDIKFIGQESVDGIPTLAYQHTIRSNTRPNTMKTWIGVADGLLRRWEFECDLLGSKPSPVIYTYYDYNAEIKIEAPELYEEATLMPPALPVPEIIQVDPRLEPPRIADLPTGDPNAPATNVDQRPIPLNSAQPRYTEEALKNKIQGVALARALIGPDGSVKKVTITRGLPDGLDEQAIQAAYQLRFKPAMKGGQPVAFLQTVQIEFNLRNDSNK
jgi:TonB family protein